MYSIYYNFFEVFPLVYISGIDKPGSPTQGYGFNIGQMGLIFLSILVGAGIAIPSYILYIYKVTNPDVRANGLGAPEVRLIPALYASFLVPIGLFIFAWTANNSPKIHWIVPTIGIIIFMIGIFLLFHLFAGNDFVRSASPAGAIHYTGLLLHNLGVGRGVTLLAALTIGGVFGVFILYFYGATLRAKSRFAAN